MAHGAKVVVLYRTPDNPEAFDSWYFGVHAPLVEVLPGLTMYEVHKAVGKDAPYYLMAEMTFASIDDLRACLRSEPMGAVVQDVEAYAAGSYTVLIFDTVMAQELAHAGEVGEAS